MRKGGLNIDWVSVATILAAAAIGGLIVFVIFFG